ncbi:MAG TPA: hypothetical protein VJN18_05585 [Polyangiaceae bacterium]|nr:hypothetical protein [Polyangiaceae bacterium]
MLGRWQSWIVMLASCLLLWAAPADAHVKIKKFTGRFTSSQVLPCDTLCTGGPLTGGLAGTLSWHMDLMEPTDDPNVVKLTGVNTITTASGSFQGTDYILWNLATGDFVDVTVVSSGTGAFAGAKGTLVIQGFFDPAAGQGISKYVAILKLQN